MTTYQAESFYRGTIRQSIANNTSVPFALKVSKIPTLTAWLLTISPNTANEEIVEYSGVDGTALTITIVKRWINPSSQVLTTDTSDYNNVLFMKNHSQNDSIRWDVNHIHISQMTWYFNLSENEITLWNNTHSWAEIFDKSIRFPVYADATARDVWIPSPTNGMVIYNTALWVLQQYVAWAWAAFASGTTTNADTTSSGKVEIATYSEASLGTNTWGSWATLAVTPWLLKSYFWYWGWSDWDVVISTNTSLSRDMFYQNLTVNTWVVLNPNWYIIYVNWTLTLTWTAKIARNWNTWGNAVLNAVGAWGAALATWTCWPCLWWASWWVKVAGVNWESVSPSYLTATWVAWGAWGNWYAWWTWGTSTQWALYNTRLSLAQILALLISPSRNLLNSTAYGWAPSNWGWGGGVYYASDTYWWAGGWSGWQWWIIFIYANILAWTGTIEANGWVGWTWWNWQALNGWGGGGWAWWNGWVVVLTYTTWTPYTISVTWWTGWAGWTGSWYPNGAVGSNGVSWISTVTTI